MSDRKTHTVDQLQRETDWAQRNYLSDQGWKYTMWRWYWVWRRHADGVQFTCMTVDEALRVQRALESIASSETDDGPLTGEET